LLVFGTLFFATVNFAILKLATAYYINNTKEINTIVIINHSINPAGIRANE
jgi:hypothetical protein